MRKELQTSGDGCGKDRPAENEVQQHIDPALSKLGKPNEVERTSCKRTESDPPTQPMLVPSQTLNPRQSTENP